MLSQVSFCVFVDKFCFCICTPPAVPLFGCMFLSALATAFSRISHVYTLSQIRTLVTRATSSLCEMEIFTRTSERELARAFPDSVFFFTTQTQSAEPEAWVLERGFQGLLG